MFRHALRNRADFSGDNYFVKKWQKSAPKKVKEGEGNLQECYVIFKGGYSKVLRGVTGGRGCQFCRKKSVT